MSVRKICILGLEDYAMLIGDTSIGHVGGESVQHVLLARAWRDLGFDVSIIVLDHGQPRVTTHDGIRAIAAFSRKAGLPGTRFVTPRLTGVLRALTRADADVYYQSPAAHWSGVVAYFGKHARKKTVIRIASDSDCVRGMQPLRYKQHPIRFKRDRWMYDYGVLNASLVAAQTQHQHDLLNTHYGVHSEIINIAVETPAAVSPEEKDIDVLWVGNLREVKRPDVALELARRLPQLRFAFVGGSVGGSEAYYERIAAEARALPNVTFVGAVPYEQTGNWFDRSRVHVNTSDYEGFPNTYLQAWIRCVPVVTFCDPDRIIERRELGRACSGVDDMQQALEALSGDPAGCAAYGRRGYAFAAGEFSATQIAKRYIELLQSKQFVAAHMQTAGWSR